MACFRYLSLVQVMSPAAAGKQFILQKSGVTQPQIVTLVKTSKGLTPVTSKMSIAGPQLVAGKAGATIVKLVNWPARLQGLERQKILS